MKIKEVYQHLMETAIIVSEVFQKLMRSGKLDEDYILHRERETVTYATLRRIAEDIEDEMSELNEDESGRLGAEAIRRLAENHILIEYGDTWRLFGR